MTRLAPATALLLAVGASATLAAPPAADHPPPHAPWLHLSPADPAESRLSPDRLRLAPEREAAYREEGLATVEVLHRDEHDWVDASTLHKRRVRARQYLTAEGVRETGNMEVSVRTRFQELWVDEAWTLLPDGRRRPVDLSAVQLVNDAESDLFSDDVTVIVPFDGLEAGATAVLVTRVVERVGDWPLPWSQIVFPQGWVPIEHYVFETRWKEPLAPRVLSTDAEFLECDNGPDHIRCRADQVPAVPGRSDSPIWLDVLPQIVVSEPQSWTELVRAERRLVDRSVASDRGIEEAVQKLIAGATTEEEKLDRIHRFVADQIRYLGLEHGASAVEPLPVERTLDARYGDCKGKVALLVAMARHAGIPAYPMLVSTGRNDLGKLIQPSWQYFDHMIVCVDRPGGEEVCLDPTTANAPTGVLPQGLYGSVALGLREGEERPRAIDLLPATVKIEVRNETELACDGDIEEKLERRHTGANGVWERAFIRSSTVEERTDWARDQYKAVMGEATEPSFRFAGIEDLKVPPTVVSTTHFEKAFPREQTEYYEYDSWLAYYARRYGTSNEYYPWFVPGVRIESRTTFKLCPRDSVRFAGPELNLGSEFGTLTRTIRRQPHAVVVQSTLELRPQTIPRDALDRYRRFMDSALDQANVWFMVKRSEAGGGSR